MKIVTSAASLAVLIVLGVMVVLGGVAIAAMQFVKFPEIILAANTTGEVIANAGGTLGEVVSTPEIQMRMKVTI